MVDRSWLRILPAAFAITAVLAVMGAARVETAFPLAPAPTPSPAPAAFDNKSNGFTDQKDFDKDKDAFDETEEVFHKDKTKDREEVRGGLGPVYNSTSCVACHQNAGFVVMKKGAGKFTNENPPGSRKFFSGNDAVSGPSSQVSEIRAGHNEVLNNKIFFRDAPGGSVIQQRAIDPRIQERVPVEEDKRALRIATNVLGDGFVESIPDKAIIDIRNGQTPDVRGFAVCDPVAVDVKRIPQTPNGQPDLDADGQPKDFVFEARVGRFGWKSQEASLLNFAAGAYAAEMGITSPLNRDENTFLGRSVAAFDPVKDPEDHADFMMNPAIRFGQDVEAFARFMRSTKAPPRTITPEVAASVREGEKRFREVGCNACHVEKFTTAPAGTKFGDFTVDTNLGNKIIHPYSDFLLHDIDTPDNIVQTQYAEFPPFPITRSAVTSPADFARDPLNARVSYDINVDRLNALLRCESEQGSPSLDSLQVDRLQDRSALSELQRIYTRTPPIRVERATDSFRRLGVLGGLKRLSLTDNELFQMPLLFTITTARMIRTAPLWGLRTRPQLLHDGRALTLVDAIEAHHKQAEKSRLLFNALPDSKKKQLLDFLNSL